MDSDQDQWIKAALLKVERNLDLPTNSLVDEVMLKPVDVKPLQVRLKKNFMATVPDYRIRHSRFARMQKRIAEQDILISELISTLIVQNILNREDAFTMLYNLAKLYFWKRSWGSVSVLTWSLDFFSELVIVSKTPTKHVLLIQGHEPRYWNIRWIFMYTTRESCKLSTISWLAVTFFLQLSQHKWIGRG